MDFKRERDTCEIGIVGIVAVQLAGYHESTLYVGFRAGPGLAVVARRL